MKPISSIDIVGLGALGVLYADFFTRALGRDRVRVLADHDRIQVFGTRSGRNTDKQAESGMTLAYTESGVPYVAESEWVLVCRKLYAQDMKPECLTDDRPERFYEGEAWHRMYIGEVVEAYAR